MRLGLYQVVCLAITLAAPAAVRADLFYVETDLVTNNQAAHPAQITDTNLVNPWGISHAPKGPFWVSDNGTGVSTLYKVNPDSNATSALGLVVGIPGAGSVTGQVFNGTGSFNKDPFLFVSEDGTISGWRGALGTHAETFQAGSAANVYKGVALGTVSGDDYLYAANFRQGVIDVVKGNNAAPNLTGTFTDPNLPAGYAPFNVQNLHGTLYVTYAQQDAQKHDEVPGAGKGFVDAYDENGNLLSRIGTGGTLNAPWGLAIAPSSFGKLSGDLLVGNFGDGTINAFNATTDQFDGQLKDSKGNAIAIDGLWGLSAGNGFLAGSVNNLYFTAGPDGETNGVFGSLSAVPEPSQFVLLGLVGVAGLSARLLRRRRGTSSRRQEPNSD